MQLDQGTVEIIQRLATFFPCFLLALTFHEFAHAWVASKFGDQTAAYEGRLTLNPIVHIDPVGTIVFPLINVVTGFPLLGWAKPVPIDARQFKNHRAGMFFVSFAGPMSNFILGFLAAMVLVAVARFVPTSFEFKNAMVEFAKAFVQMNFMLGVFNLLPVPPLDGSQMLLAVLPYDTQRKVYEFWDKAYFLLFFLMFIGAFRFIWGPIEFLSHASIYLAALLFGLPMSG